MYIYIHTYIHIHIHTCCEGTDSALNRVIAEAVCHVYNQLFIYFHYGNDIMFDGKENTKATKREKKRVLQIYNRICLHPHWLQLLYCIARHIYSTITLVLSVLMIKKTMGDGNDLSLSFPPSKLPERILRIALGESHTKGCKARF